MHAICFIHLTLLHLSSVKIFGEAPLPGVILGHKNKDKNPGTHKWNEWMHAVLSVVHQFNEQSWFPLQFFCYKYVPHTMYTLLLWQNEVLHSILSKTGPKCPILLVTLSTHTEVWRYVTAFVGTQLQMQLVAWNEENLLLFIFKANLRPSPSTYEQHNQTVNSNKIHVQLMHFLLMLLLFFMSSSN